MFQKSYRIRNFFKERICQINDLINHALLHPYQSVKKKAHNSSVRFILKNCPRATACRSPKKLMDIAINAVGTNGAYLEFGVFKGASINYIARKKHDKKIYGFDSFEGLQEAWAHNPKYSFSLGGKLPKVKNNVILCKGYFEKTLPEWLEKHDDKIAFLHIDCDLYSSTKTIFDCLKERLQAGTVIVFDDYFNFPGWEEDAHRVFTDFTKETKLRFEYLGYSYKELAIIIRSITF